MGHIRKGIGKVLLFCGQPFALLPQAQGHFPDLCFQNGQFSLVLSRKPDLASGMQKRVDLPGKPCDPAVAQPCGQHRNECHDKAGCKHKPACLPAAQGKCGSRQDPCRGQMPEECPPHLGIAPESHQSTR